MTMNMARGYAKSDDSSTAGKQAAEQAAETVEDADVVFVFSSPDHADTAMLDAVAAVYPDAEIIGCSTGGELWNTDLMTGGIVLMALEDDGMDISIGVGDGIADDERAAGRNAAEAALDGLDKESFDFQEMVKEDGEWETEWPITFTVFMTTLTGNGSEVMRGVQEMLGEGAHVSGGLAGDDWQLSETYIYHNGEVLTDAILVAALDTDNTVTHGIRHGLEKTDHRYKVTASEDNIVKELDGEPVADVYEEVYGERGKSPQFIMTKPLGIEVGEEEPRLRDPLDINDDGSIVYAAEVQEDSLVHIMKSPKEHVIDAARTATEQAVEEAGNPDQDDIKGVVLHDCVCRWYCLDNDDTRRREIEAVQDVVGEDTPIVGWYTYGEIALPRALAGVHNQTLVVQLFTE